MFTLEEGSVSMANDELGTVGVGVAGKVGKTNAGEQRVNLTAVDRAAILAGLQQMPVLTQTEKSKFMLQTSEPKLTVHVNSS